MSEVSISVNLTRVGVSMGDRAQDITNALDIDPNTTLEELVRSVLFSSSDAWNPERVAQYDDYLTVRIAKKI